MIMKSHTMNDRQRRRFLATGMRTIVGAGLALGVDPMFTLAHAADDELGIGPSVGDDYRALVCVFLQGGADGFSLVVPTDNAGHAEYMDSRGTLALGRGQLLDLPSASASGPSIGLHESAAALRPLYAGGRLALISNVGNLIEPTTREQYESNAVTLPSQLFSHADQEVQWQQLQGRHSARDGWGALAAGYLADGGSHDYLTSISLAGANYWQAGTSQRPFSMRDTGIVSYPGMDAGSDWQRPRREAFERVLELERRHLLSRGYADLQRRAMNNTAELGAVLAQRFPEGSADPIVHDPEQNELAASLNMVAKLIAVQPELGLRRQIFYVRMGGFDVHDNQNRELPELFAELADALAGFQGALDGLGVSGNVTTFTASDFGRSLTSNGDGTDHGWGNHLFAMGGAVRGGELYGTLPRMSVDGPDAVANGRVVPTLSASQYAATLLTWIGLDDTQLDRVLPDLANFSTRDLGFLT